MVDAEIMISKLLQELPGAASGVSTWTPTDLLNRIDVCLEEIESVATSFTLCSNDSTGELTYRNLPTEGGTYWTMCVFNRF